MDDLAKQVKQEMLRTLIWMIISMGVGAAVYYMIW